MSKNKFAMIVNAADAVTSRVFVERSRDKKPSCNEAAITRAQSAEVASKVLPEFIVAYIRRL